MYPGNVKIESVCLSLDHDCLVPSNYGWSREKVPKVLSRCHTKRRTGRARPSFGMTPTFQKKKKKKYEDDKNKKRTRNKIEKKNTQKLG